MELNNSSKKRIKRILLITVILCLIEMSFYTFTNENDSLMVASAQQNPWSLTLQITESSGTANTVVLGASPNASDGQDDLDLPEPPAPPQLPYLRAWFTTSFSIPFNRLLREYKHIPSQRMQWNLSIIWVSEPGNNSSTIINISWNPSQVAQSGFKSFQLYDDDTVVTNMLTENSYSFPSNDTVHHFQIIAQGASTDGTSDQNTSTNGTSAQNTIPMLLIVLAISVLIIVIIIVLFFYKRKT
jgi:hypothetical protein